MASIVYQPRTAESQALHAVVRGQVVAVIQRFGGGLNQSAGTLHPLVLL